MSKSLGSWSRMRKYLEQEMLAECLRGRIRYGCTTNTGMDNCKVFEICADGKQLKRFSWETVNTYFICNKLKENNAPYGSIEYWNGFFHTLSSIPPTERTEYTDEEFCSALETYRNQDIQSSIHSDNPLIRMFAILDRRIGKRTLCSIESSVESQPR